MQKRNLKKCDAITSCGLFCIQKREGRQNYIKNVAAVKLRMEYKQGKKSYKYKTLKRERT